MLFNFSTIGFQTPTNYFLHTMYHRATFFKSLSGKRMCLDVYNNFHSDSKSKYTLGDLLKGKDLEIVAASLLLLGKLKVDSIQLYRDKPIISVELLGEFKNLNDRKVNEMADFLEKNGDMTLDEVFEGIKKRMNK